MGIIMCSSYPNGFILQISLDVINPTKHNLSFIFHSLTSYLSEDNISPVTLTKMSMESFSPKVHDDGY